MYVCVCVCNVNKRKLYEQLLCHYQFISTSRVFFVSPLQMAKQGTWRNQHCFIETKKQKKKIVKIQ